MNLVLLLCVSTAFGVAVGGEGPHAGNFMANTPTISFQGQNILLPGPSGLSGFMSNPWSTMEMFKHPFFSLHGNDLKNRDTEPPSASGPIEASLSSEPPAHDTPHATPDPHHPAGVIPPVPVPVPSVPAPHDDSPHVPDSPVPPTPHTAPPIPALPIPTLSAPVSALPNPTPPTLPIPTPIEVPPTTVEAISTPDAAEEASTPVSGTAVTPPEAPVIPNPTEIVPDNVVLETKSPIKDQDEIAAEPIKLTGDTSSVNLEPPSLKPTPPDTDSDSPLPSIDEKPSVDTSLLHEGDEGIASAEKPDKPENPDKAVSKKDKPTSVTPCEDKWNKLAEANFTEPWHSGISDSVNLDGLPAVFEGSPVNICPFGSAFHPGFYNAYNPVCGGPIISPIPHSYPCFEEPILPPIPSLNITCQDDSNSTKSSLSINDSIANETCLCPVIDHCLNNIPCVSHPPCIIPHHIPSCIHKPLPYHLPITRHIPITRGLNPCLPFSNCIPSPPRPFIRPIVEPCIRHMPYIEPHVKQIGRHHCYNRFPLNERSIIPQCCDNLIYRTPATDRSQYSHIDSNVLPISTNPSTCPLSIKSVPHQVSAHIQHRECPGPCHSASRSSDVAPSVLHYGEQAPIEQAAAPIEEKHDLPYPCGLGFGNDPIIVRGNLYHHPSAHPGREEDLYEEASASSEPAEYTSNRDEGYYPEEVSSGRVAEDQYESQNEDDYMGCPEDYCQPDYGSNKGDENVAAPLANAVPFPAENAGHVTEESNPSYTRHPDYCE